MTYMEPRYRTTFANMRFLSIFPWDLLHQGGVNWLGASYTWLKRNSTWLYVSNP